MPKREVYSWRVSRDVKIRLEDAARRERRSVAAVLDDIVSQHFAGRREHDDAARQRQLQASASAFAGALRGSDPERAANVTARVRARLRHRRGHAGSRAR